MKKRHATLRPRPKRGVRIVLSTILVTGLAASVSIAVTAAQPGHGSRGNYGVVSPETDHSANHPSR